MNQLKVVKSYQAAFENPVHLLTGEVVEIGTGDDEYPGWLWCTTSSGNQGWVPERYLEVVGTKGRLQCDYDATELTVERGAIVEVIAEVAGWVWCRAANDRHGWIPRICLDG